MVFIERVPSSYCPGLTSTLTRYIWIDNESKSQQTSYRGIMHRLKNVSKVLKGLSYKKC